MVTQLQPDVRAYLHGGEVIKRYIRIEEVAHEYGFSVEETEYIAKAASSLYKLTRIHLVKKERFDEFMKHIYKVPGTNKQIIKKFEMMAACMEQKRLGLANKTIMVVPKPLIGQTASEFLRMP